MLMAAKLIGAGLATIALAGAAVGISWYGSSRGLNYLLLLPFAGDGYCSC